MIAAAAIVVAAVVPAAAAAQQNDQQNDPPTAIPGIITPTHEHSPHFNWRGHTWFSEPSESFYDRRLSPVPGM